MVEVMADIINLAINPRYGISLPSELSNGKFDDREYYLFYAHYIITTDFSGRWRIWDIDARNYVFRDYDTYVEQKGSIEWNYFRSHFDSLEDAIKTVEQANQKNLTEVFDFWEGNKAKFYIETFFNDSQLSALKHKLTKQEKEDIIDRTPTAPYSPEWVPLRLREDKVQYLQGKLPCPTCNEKIFTSLTAAERHHFYCKEYGFQPPNGLYFTPMEEWIRDSNLMDMKNAEDDDDYWDDLDTSWEESTKPISAFTKEGLDAAMDRSKPYITPDESWVLTKLKKLLRPTWDNEPDYSNVSKSDLVEGGFGKKDINKIVKSLSQKEYIVFSDGIIYSTPSMYLEFGYVVDWMYDVSGYSEKDKAIARGISYFNEAESDNYDNTYGKKQGAIRRRLKNKIMGQAIVGTKKGQWSARKSQELKRQYEEACEKKGLKAYKGKKTKKQKDLSKWSKQDWTTKSGKPSSETGERYLPSKAIKALTDKEYKKTSDKKRKDSKKGKQFSDQPKKIADKVAKYRAKSTKPHSVTISRSSNPEKKLMAVFEDSEGKKIKTTHFGQRGASDYTKHGEKERMERYLERHGGGFETSTKEDWKDPTTAGSLSRWILWNKPSLNSSFNDYKRKFGLKGDLKVSKSAESNETNGLIFIPLLIIVGCLIPYFLYSREYKV